ncbi:MAG: MBL fold metallo-hydrolase, partial [SAR202 cluster bacterium]|nr:MBL fold metallo-hydrolase [SAR202 cluster bacterium]
MPHSTLTVGSVELTVLHDAEVASPFEQSFPEVPAEAWEPYLKRYPEAFIGGNSRRTHFECYLVRSKGRIVLVDTGLGTSATNPGTVDQMFGGTQGNLLGELESAGYQPGDIDTVFLTHLHLDHVGWNMTQSGGLGTPTFPNARYIGNEADWAAFNTPKDKEIFGFSWWEDTVAPLKKAGVLDLVTEETKLDSELTITPTPGHTPGSMSLVINSGGETAFLLGDVFHGPAQVTETDWVFRFDMDSEQAGRT